MSRVHVLITGVILLTVALIWTTPWLAADVAKPSQASLEPLKDKFVVISHFNGDGAYLEKPQLKQLGDEFFLVGKSIRIPGDANWEGDNPVWVRVKEIMQVVEFDSRESMTEAISTIADEHRLRQDRE